MDKSTKNINHDKVLALISKDKKLPTHMNDMIAKTGLTRRKITDIIRELRKEYPICSTKVESGGYWLGDREDLRRVIIEFKSTAHTLNQTAENLTSLLNGAEFNGYM